MSKTVDINGIPTTVADDDPRFPTPCVEPPPPPPVSGDAIIGAMAKADRAKVDPVDLTRIAWRDDVPLTNPKLVRIAKAIGTTADALRQAATSGF